MENRRFKKRVEVVSVSSYWAYGNEETDCLSAVFISGVGRVLSSEYSQWIAGWRRQQ